MPTETFGPVMPLMPQLDLPSVQNQVENPLPLVNSLPPTSLDVFRKDDRLTVVNNLPITDPAPGFRFTQQQERFARDLIAASGLPLTHVSSLAYRPNTHGTRGVLATAEFGGIHDGRVSFYTDMGRISAAEQLGVGVHELAHVSSPSLERNNDVYQGEDNRLRAARHVLNVAWQSHKTGIFLNDYHQYIHERWQSGEDDARTWFEETHAILLEMDAAHPEELERIDRAQYNALAQRELAQEFTPLVSRENPETGEVEISETDTTLMTLMGMNNLQDVHEHFRHLRHVLKNVQTPFNETIPTPLPPMPIERVIVIGYITRQREQWEEDLLELLGLKLPENERLRRYGSTH